MKRGTKGGRRGEWTRGGTREERMGGLRKLLEQRMSAGTFLQLKREMKKQENDWQRLVLLTQFLELQRFRFSLTPHSICNILPLFIEDEQNDARLCALQTCLPFTEAPFIFKNLLKVCKFFRFGKSIGVAVKSVLERFKMDKVTAREVQSLTDLTDFEFYKLPIIRAFVDNVPVIVDKHELPRAVQSFEGRREVSRILALPPLPISSVFERHNHIILPTLPPVALALPLAVPALPPPSTPALPPAPIPVIDLCDDDSGEVSPPVSFPSRPSPPVFPVFNSIFDPPEPIAQPKPKRARVSKKFNLADLEGTAEATDNEKDQCIVCCENKKTVVFIACLHVCCCVDCARKLKTNECPYCRQQIVNAHNSKPVE